VVAKELYTLKTADLKFLGRSGLGLGLNYAATRLADAGFDSGESTSSNAPVQASRLMSNLISPWLGPLRLQSDLILWDFTTTYYMSSWVNMPRLPRSGSASMVDAEDVTTTSTTYMQFFVQGTGKQLVKPTSTIYLGYNLTKISTTGVVSLTGTDENTGESTIFSALADIDYSCHAASLRFEQGEKAPELGLSGYTNVGFVVGSNTSATPWFDMKSTCIGQYGNAELRYRARRYSLVVGYNYAQFNPGLAKETVSLNKEIPYVTPFDEQRTAAGGEYWEVFLPGNTFYFTGPYLRLSAGF